jgi:uncharacterized membrane protein
MKALAVLLRCVLVAAGCAPFLPALAAHFPLLGGLSRGLDAWFAFQCERDPARMLAVGAVCARCLGLYVGLGLGALLAWPRLAFPRLELALAVAVTLLLLDVASEGLGWRGASAPLRLATGLAFGYVAGVIVVARLVAPRSTAAERG